jgi:nucleotide-binding universal stress UspA family protein
MRSMNDDTTMKRRSRASSASAPQGLRSVLVPVDLTAVSDRVLGRLSLLSLAEDARVTLLHVVPGSIQPGDRPCAESDARKALSRETRHLQKSLSRRVKVESQVTVGAPAKEIATCATHVKADIIVMGRGGGRALRDAFMGSTAERVVRQSRLPVLVVRLPARAPYHRPALALDLDQAAHEIVRVMLHVLPEPRPRVTVIHAFDTPYQSMVYPSLAADEAEERVQGLLVKSTRELRTLLAKALAKEGVGPADAPAWKIQVRHGSPRLVVERALKKAETDLLVVGTRGYTGAAYVLLGTIAGDLLREAKCDVLVVPLAASAR